MSFVRNTVSPFYQKVSSQVRCLNLSSKPSNSVLTNLLQKSNFKHFEPNLTRQPNGRSVTCSDNYEVGKAWAKLGHILRSNNVRFTVKKAQVYEKPGDKRQRLAIERRNKVFNEIVRNKVQIVMQMKNRYTL
jgi:hypothetical protein